MKKKEWSDYELTESQIKACEKVREAFREAQNEGLVFLDKSCGLTAYNREAIAFSIPLGGSADIGKKVPCYVMADCTYPSWNGDVEFFPDNFFENEEEDYGI